MFLNVGSIEDVRVVGTGAHLTAVHEPIVFAVDADDALVERIDLHMRVSAVCHRVGDAREQAAPVDLT